VILDIKKNKKKQLLALAAVNTFRAAGQLFEELVQSGHDQHRTLIGSHFDATDHHRFSAVTALRELVEHGNMVLWAPISHETHSDHQDQSLSKQHTLSLIQYLAEYSENTLDLMIEHAENGGVMVLALVADELEKVAEHTRLMQQHGTFAFHTTEILPFR